MKHPFRFSILPFFTMGVGGLGLALRVWLFSSTDDKGLLPAGHPADTMLYILTALVLGILFLATRQSAPAPCSRKVLRSLGAAAHVAAFFGMLLTALLDLAGSGVSLALIATAACLAGSVLLLYMAILTWNGKPTSYILLVVFTAALMLITVAQCQVWGAEPQLQVFFFPLMASVFSILAAYHRTALAAGSGKRNMLAFFSQGALFFCCLSLNADQWLLYLGLAAWSAAQLIPCYRKKKEA